MDSSDRDYLKTRAEQELRNADAASDPRAREAHLKLAHEYQVKVNVQIVRARADNDELGVVTSAGDRSVFRDPDPQL